MRLCISDTHNFNLLIKK